MIHPEHWERLSNEFSVSVGMLIWDGKITEEDNRPLPEINRLILREIGRGNYNETRRRFLRLERTARRDTSELTLYKKAIKTSLILISNFQNQMR
jgi:hypothetical protein